MPIHQACFKLDLPKSETYLQVMASNPRRESLSLFDILNPASETHATVQHHIITPGANYAQQQSEQAEPTTTAFKAEHVPLYDQPMDAPSLMPLVQVKTEASREPEFNEDDQELLAAAEVSSPVALLSHCLSAGY